MSPHGRTVCSCGALIAQCRCPEPYTESVVPNGCDACKRLAAQDFETVCTWYRTALTQISRLTERLESAEALSEERRKEIERLEETWRAAGVDPKEQTEIVSLRARLREIREGLDQWEKTKSAVLRQDILNNIIHVARSEEKEGGANVC